MPRFAKPVPGFLNSWLPKRFVDGHFEPARQQLKFNIICVDLSISEFICVTVIRAASHG